MCRLDSPIRQKLSERAETLLFTADLVPSGSRVAALREAIAALDNAEAIPPDGDLKAEAGEYVAGGVVGLGAAEAERRILDAEEQRAIVRAVIEMRLAAASTYDEHGQERTSR